MCFGGGGGGGSTEFKPPSYTTDAWKSYLQQAQDLAGKGLTQFQGQQTAPLTGMTVGGLQQLTDFAQQGTPERQAGGMAIVNAAQGNMNPYAAAANPYATAGNPYMQAMLDQSNAAIADKYRTGTAAQNDASFARQGAYGGSAYQAQTSRNQTDLANALAANSNNLLGNQYNQAAQLQESGLNRGAGGWQNAVGNSLNAAQIGLGQQAADQSAIQAMIGGGQIPQQNYQQQLDAAQRYFDQGQQQPFTLSDFLGSALQRASGGQGTQTYTGGGLSPVTAGLGALGLGAGLFGWGK